MIVRTYQRRNRIGRRLSDGGGGDGTSTSQQEDSSSPWSSSYQEAFPSSSFPSSSQESGWWQSDHGNRALLSSGSAGAQEGVGANLVRPRSLTWTYQKKTHEDLMENSIMDTHSMIDAEGRFSHEIEGGAARMESLMLNGDFTSSKSLKHRCNWSQTVMSTGISGGATTPAISTLLEAQESGEMMEHMDEANFALDGLRPEQPLQIQRASLQSLLSLCGSIQCRRILRTHRYMFRSLYLHWIVGSCRQSPCEVAQGFFKFVVSSYCGVKMAVW
jgi:hypothetical protein